MSGGVVTELNICPYLPPQGYGISSGGQSSKFRRTAAAFAHFRFPDLLGTPNARPNRAERARAVCALLSRMLLLSERGVGCSGTGTDALRRDP